MSVSLADASASQKVVQFLPFLVPDAAGFLGTGVTAITVGAVATSIVKAGIAVCSMHTFADNALVLKANHHHAGDYICLFHCFYVFV